MIGNNLYKEVNISSAQLLSIGTSNVELLPVIGESVYYDIERIIVEYKHVTTPYAFAGDYINISLLNNAMTINTDLITNSYDSFVVLNSFAVLNEVTNGLNYPDLLYLGYPLTLGTLLFSDPTGGDGTLKIRIWYNIRKFG